MTTKRICPQCKITTLAIYCLRCGLANWCITYSRAEAMALFKRAKRAETRKKWRELLELLEQEK